MLIKHFAISLPSCPRMKLKPNFSAVIVLLLTLSIAAPLLAHHNTKSAPVTQTIESRDTFILHRSTKGETTCKVATPVEENKFSVVPVNGEHHVIYNGAPLRRAGRDRWRPTFAPELSLQTSAGLRIVLHGTAQLEQSQTAKNAFIVAANRWEAIISTPITIVLDVDFGPTFFGTPYDDPDILGATSATLVSQQYDNVRSRLLERASTPEETQLYNALPVTSVPTIANSVAGSVSDMRITRPNSRALGLSPDISNPDAVASGQGDASIGFNSAFAFDFTPDNGIETDKVDFDSVASHEIGHALGFTSRAGAQPVNSMSIWDLFRFTTAGPTIDVSTFTSRQRELSLGGFHRFWSNRLSTFGTFDLNLSTGGPNPGPSDGDGRQSSHWKDDALSSSAPYIGLMDPTLADGLRRTISENDLNALDLFGYSNGAPPPVRPPNDNFINSVTLNDVSGATTGSNINATREPLEPAHAGLMGDKSIWYSWTAPLNGTATFSTGGATNFDSTLGIYTGNSVSQLTVIAGNDDRSSSDRTSQVSFHTNAGVTYRIAVDGWNGESGNVALSWSSTGTPPPTEDASVESFTLTPNPVRSGRYVTINTVVKNNGPSTDFIGLTVELPAGASLASCNPSCTGQFGGNGGVVRVSVGFLAPNTTQAVTITVQVVAQPGTLSFSGTVATPIPDPVASNNSLSAQVTVIEPILLSGVTQISSRGGHLLALRSNGTVWAWGPNGNGQLGTGEKSSTNATVPVQANNISDVKAVVASSNASVVLLNNGSVWAWGSNNIGQLGVDSDAVTESLVPMRVAGLDSVTAIAGGSNHFLALKSDGTVWSWGSNSGDALGTGVFLYQKAPKQVPGLTNIVKIFAGPSNGFAVRNDGTVFGWGSNGFGQLGLGTTGNTVPTPVEIASLKNAKKIAAADSHTLVLKNDGTVWSCGSNRDGRLGQGLADSDNHATPAQLAGLNAIDVAAATHSLVLLTDGTVQAFGTNGSGELGLTFRDSNPHPSPVSVPNLPSVSSVTALPQASFATIGELSPVTTLKSWGANGTGLLANGSFNSSFFPLAVPESFTVGRPIISRRSGVIYPGSEVRLLTGTPQATVRYTLNGQDPTASDPVALPGVPIQLNQTSTLKARAFRDEFESSEVASANYILSPTPNLIDDARLFVRQQYLDFLGREPDQSGWDFWTNEITSCGSDASCIEVKRINVSAAFFLSIECQQTGFYAERVYKVAFGDLNGTSTFNGIHSIKVPIINLTDMTAERSLLAKNLIVGQPGWEAQLETNKNGFYQAFNSSTPFIQAFPPFATPGTVIVDAMNANAGFPLSTSERDALVAAYEANNRNRILVLRAIVEHPNFVNSEVNRAFVLMQYFGYLQRNPNSLPDADHTGYDFWLTKLNDFHGNFVNAEMVKAFIVSSEYRNRFQP